MSVLALINPTTLVGQELREKLEQRSSGNHEIRLLGSRPEEEGRLTEVGGGAALVKPFEAKALEDADLIFLCGPRASLTDVLKALPPAATAILLAPDAAPDDGVPVVAGINPEAARRGERLLSPHPAAVAVAHLLHPLASFAPVEAAATVLQPASMAGQEGLDELFEQTRRVLAFSSERPEQVFGRQLAFNLLPAVGASPALGPVVAGILGGDVTVSLHVLQGNVFHGLSVSLFLRLEDDPGETAVREALAGSPYLEMVEEPETLSPVDVAARDEILVGRVETLPGGGGRYHLWAVMDNLTLGSALNAALIAEELL